MAAARLGLAQGLSVSVEDLHLLIYLTNTKSASAFFVAQMFSNPLWSLLSNRIGRKACLIMGLLGTAASMLAFGVSQNLAWAIVSRSICGLMNGNNPIARTVVGELSDITGVDKARAFSLFGFCLSAGWMS